jgi:hypothetical protein
VRARSRAARCAVAWSSALRSRALASCSMRSARRSASPPTCAAQAGGAVVTVRARPSAASPRRVDAAVSRPTARPRAQRAIRRAADQGEAATGASTPATRSPASRTDATRRERSTHSVGRSANL